MPRPWSCQFADPFHVCVQRMEPSVRIAATITSLFDEDPVVPTT
jgi:hypothetical protein